MIGPVGYTGFSGLERVLKKMMEISERFESIQQHVSEMQPDPAIEKNPRQDAGSFRSALNRAQERQPTDGKKTESLAETDSAPDARRRAVPSATTTEKELMDVLRQELPKYNVPPDLALSVMQVESNFNPGARSPKGALGLMQLMPHTAASLGVEDENDLFEPQVNLQAGLTHLSNLLSKYNGNEQLALAAYNAGAGAVTRYGGVQPFAETQEYIRKVFDIRRRLNEGAPQS